MCSCVHILPPVTPQARTLGNAAKNKKDVEQLLQKIDRVEAAIGNAEALGKATQHQLDADLRDGPKCVISVDI